MASFSLTQSINERLTEVTVDNGALARLGSTVAGRLGPRTTGALITDSNVGPLYSQLVLQSFSKSGPVLEVHVIPAGEQSKSLQTIATIYEFFTRVRLARDSVVVALGGGVIGDVAGFAAGTWMRGIPWVHCSTTMESNVDSAVGGKTGVNFAGTKNLVGVFHPPSCAVVDTQCLSSLPPRDIRAGLAECAKHALLQSVEEVEWLEHSAEGILRLESGVVTELIERNLRFKGSVVSGDPLERTGVRVLLNFGHTLGHAIESASDGLLRHGECVSLGILAACRISRRAGLLMEDKVVRVERLLRRLELPTTIEMELVRARVLKALELDKKQKGGRSRLVLLGGIGNPVVLDDVPADWVADAFDSLGTN